LQGMSYLNLVRNQIGSAGAKRISQMQGIRDLHY